MAQPTSSSPRRALVVLSGGQDSTTCLFWALQRFDEVCALGFTYGQKHTHEVDIAAEICAEQHVHYEVMDVPLLGQLGSNSLTDTTLEMDADKPAGGPPNTFVPGRNLFFLSIAAVYARERGIFDLVTGVGQTDFSGYPDCRDNFIKSLNVTLNLAMDEQFRIHTPLMWLDKAQTWALADRLGVLDLIRTRTLTCYNGVVGDGCGHCPACKLRREGLELYLQSKQKLLLSPMSTRETEGLQHLGSQGTQYPDDYAPEVLETFVNKHPDNDYWVRFNCPEFTSLCPITGQPDFAEIRISYIPGERMVESKSLKLYLFSFRNHGDFHEDCVNVIMKDLVRLMQPKYIEVTGLFTPRGGISIFPYANYGRPGTKYEALADERLRRHDM